jgi:hypothetical protein
MSGRLKLRRRIAVIDRQITAGDSSGRGGIYAVLNIDGIQYRRPTVDVRYFTYSEGRGSHRSTQYGVIFSSLDEALRCAQALIELCEEARRMGLKDPGETIPPLSAKEQSIVDEARKAGA